MNILEEIKKRCESADFQEEAIDLLTKICAVETTPNPDVSLMAARENEVFDLLEKELAKLNNLNGRTEKRLINPAIKEHPAFSKLHFTKTAERPEGLSAEDTYRGRGNLLYLMDNEADPAGRNIAMNAHIDVVAPYFPPERKGDNIFGRGTIDDKGPVTVVISALKILNRLQQDGLIALQNKITAMFVIEEETGGNGSLSLALDRELKKRYDAIVVMECTDNLVYPANRGAVWFKCELKKEIPGGNADLLEAMVFAIIAVREEGQKIKDESEHPLFPHRPVQTCNGILGPFGEHPSRICGHVAFMLQTTVSRQTIELCIKVALEEYVTLYGDKTQDTDSVTGKKKVEKHYTLTETADGYKIDVFGSTGHMGSILENDDAILKFAYIAKYILKCKYSERSDIKLRLLNADTAKQLVLEGGQGFLPTHPIEEVMDRISKAGKTGVTEYLRCIGSTDRIFVNISYDKLHNAAFDGDPSSATFLNARETAIEVGNISPDSPIRGWDVSCDARLFATEYPNMPVITTGPGSLKYAHADNENLAIPDFTRSVIFTTLFLLKETGYLR